MRKISAHAFPIVRDLALFGTYGSCIQSRAIKGFVLKWNLAERGRNGDYMELEDFAQTEVGVAVALTAVATSPSIRKTLRKGAAYGLAGVLLAGDATHRFVNAVAKGAKHASASVTSSLEAKKHDTEAAPSGVENA